MPQAVSLSTLRRSSRVPVAVPILVTSLEPDSDFSEVCETMVVNAHGCAMRSSAKLEAGAPVQFQSKDGNWTMAHIVDCQPIGSGNKEWMLGAKLDHPDNFWGLESYPEDWGQLPEIGSNGKRVKKRVVTNGELKALVAEVVEPLRAEVMELRQKVAAKEPKGSQFEISLSYIPPEVQDKIATRLHDELGTQVLKQTRHQSDQLLEATKEAIGKRITDVRNQFRELLVQELEKVEQRAHVLSQEITGTVDAHLHTGEEQFQKQVLEVNIRLEKRSEELLRALRQHLSEEHEAYQREMQTIHKGVAAEAAQLHVQTTDLAGRISALDAMAHHLEADLDGRLVRIASDIISGARVQLENALNVVLKDLNTRNAKELSTQLEEACSKLKVVQKGIEASVSDLVKTKVADSLVSFGQTMEILAQDSVGRWRSGLAKDLNSLTRILGERIDVGPASGR